MERKPVDSSNIAAIGYDESSQTLEVEFKNGGVYQYFDVHLAEFEAFRDADSLGGYLAKNIKGKYRYSKV